MSRTSISEDNFAEKIQSLDLSFDRNVKSLPGTPDIVFKSKKLVIFFNGCWFHGHQCKNESTNFSWEMVHEENQKRDKKAQQELQKIGYETIVVWECEWKSNPNKIIRYINGRSTLAPLA